MLGPGTGPVVTGERVDDPASGERGFVDNRGLIFQGRCDGSLSHRLPWIPDSLFFVLVIGKMMTS